MLHKNIIKILTGYVVTASDYVINRKIGYKLYKFYNQNEV